MRDRKKYMYINFQQNRVCRSVKTVRTNLFAQYGKLHKFATTNSNFKKKAIILDMHHHKTYMYINFQQNWVKTQVITVLTSLFAKNRKLHKFCNYQKYFLKNSRFHTCIIVERTCISIFSKIGLIDQSKPCTQIYLHNIASCTHLQLPIVILKKSNLLHMHHHKTSIYINFQQNHVKTQVMTVLTSLFAKIASCINLQLPIIILNKNVI